MEIPELRQSNEQKMLKIKSGHLKFLSNEKQFRKRIKMLKSPEMLILASHR